jgi:hypothetical protein
MSTEPNNARHFHRFLRFESPIRPLYEVNKFREQSMYHTDLYYRHQSVHLLEQAPTHDKSRTIWMKHYA